MTTGGRKVPRKLISCLTNLYHQPFWFPFLPLYESEVPGRSSTKINTRTNMIYNIVRCDEMSELASMTLHMEAAAQQRWSLLLLRKGHRYPWHRTWKQRQDQCNDKQTWCLLPIMLWKRMLLAITMLYLVVPEPRSSRKDKMPTPVHICINTPLSWRVYATCKASACHGTPQSTLAMRHNKWK